MGTAPSKKTEAIKEPSSSSSGRSSSDGNIVPPNGQIESHTAMPFFRKQSDKAKKRLQHQQYLARESPELMYDISGCELNEIPPGVNSLCKVLQKEALLAHNNWLSSLKGGGKLDDLGHIRVLDLHQNEISVLPDDIHLLECLQVLNLENNRVKTLPDGVGRLQRLQTLNLRDNRLKELPDSICDMRSLRTLDISKNKVQHLPKRLCHIRTMESLILEPSDFTYPPANVCSQGTEAIMKFLCKENCMEYSPPGKFLLDVLDGPMRVPESKSSQSLKAEFMAVSNTVMEYESIKERKRQERIALEKQIEEEQLNQTTLAAQAAANKEHLLRFMAQDAERIEGELSVLQRNKEEERHRLVQTLHEVEMSSTNLVHALLDMNTKAKKTEQLLEKMEKEKMEAEQWFIVRQEEMENLRKQEVLGNMKMLLAENEAFDELFNRYVFNRESFKKKYQDDNSEADGQLEKIIGRKDKEQKLLVRHLLKEEELQKEAFEMLQMQKDAHHIRLRGQIDLIQRELAQLTLVEVEHRELKVDVQMHVLGEKRQALTDLLIQLMAERDQREVELKKRLSEMEQQRLMDQADYWLVQFQRLMDKKPESLIDMEKQLEYIVIEIVESAGATDYLPSFARHRISIETLCNMDEDDFKQMGIHEMGLRKSLLREIERYTMRQDEERAAAKKKLMDEPPKDEWLVEPPGPSGADAQKPLTPTAPGGEDIVARGVNSECVICMDSVSSMLFLNCGHVCCCSKCAGPLKECPMCRGEILQRIRLACEPMAGTEQ